MEKQQQGNKNPYEDKRSAAAEAELPQYRMVNPRACGHFQRQLAAFTTFSVIFVLERFILQLFLSCLPAARTLSRRMSRTSARSWCRIAGRKRRVEKTTFKKE